MCEEKKNDTEEQPIETGESSKCGDNKNCDDNVDRDDKCEETEKSELPCDNEKTDGLINDHVVFSMIAGAIPFPIVDIAAITAIQIDLTKQLAKAYGVDFNMERGKSLATALTGATLGTMLGRIGASALKAVPGVGTILGIGSQVIFAGASTYALGMVFNSHFKNKGTMFDVNMDDMKNQFEMFLKKGKDVAENLKKKNKDKSKEDIAETIKTLKSLYESGTISEEEFEKSKKELLDKLIS